MDLVSGFNQELSFCINQPSPQPRRNPHVCHRYTRVAELQVWFFVMLIQYYDRYLLVGRAEQQTAAPLTAAALSLSVSIRGGVAGNERMWQERTAPIMDEGILSTPTGWCDLFDGPSAFIEQQIVAAYEVTNSAQWHWLTCLINLARLKSSRESLSLLNDGTNGPGSTLPTWNLKCH